jgi:hypothetical protein
MGKEQKMQPSLIQMATPKDVVYTPSVLALDVVSFFKPSGICLDPCAGGNAFYSLLPEAGRDWCEIERGRDFYAWDKKVDWIVSNPPFSNLLAWVRHSFKVANDIVYIMPYHRGFASMKFVSDLMEWGGIVHTRWYGTGTEWGFPFGHALAAVHYRAGYTDSQTWSRYEAQHSTHLTAFGVGGLASNSLQGLSPADVSSAKHGGR